LFDSKLNKSIAAAQGSISLDDESIIKSTNTTTATKETSVVESQNTTSQFVVAKISTTEQVSKPMEVKKDGQSGWICSFCELQNSHKEKFCIICGTPCDELKIIPISPKKEDIEKNLIDDDYDNVTWEEEDAVTITHIPMNDNDKGIMNNHDNNSDSDDLDNNSKEAENNFENVKHVADENKKVLSITYVPELTTSSYISETSDRRLWESSSSSVEPERKIVKLDPQQSARVIAAAASMNDWSGRSVQKALAAHITLDNREGKSTNVSSSYSSVPQTIETIDDNVSLYYSADSTYSGNIPADSIDIDAEIQDIHRDMNSAKRDSEVYSNTI
jgi:hypothetical protein